MIGCRIARWCTMVSDSDMLQLLEKMVCVAKWP